MAEIDNAIREMNAVLLNRAAHELRGSVVNFGARRAVEIALRLEMMGKGEELGGAGDVYYLLTEEVECLMKALIDFIGEARRQRRAGS